MVAVVVVVLIAGDGGCGGGGDEYRWDGVVQKSHHALAHSHCSYYSSADDWSIEVEPVQDLYVLYL